MWYDNETGIEERLDNLLGLNELIAARRKAGYKDHQRMNEFCVLGTYMLDTCGNCGIIDQEFIPREKIPYLPRVLTYAELNKHIREYDRKTKPNVLTHKEIENMDLSKNTRPFPPSVSYSFSKSVPPHDTVCPVCGKVWTIDNCWDTHVQYTQKSLDTKKEKSAIGKTIPQLEQWLNERPDSKSTIYAEQGLRNDRYINLEPNSKYPSLKINELGWVDIPESYIVQEGDEICYNEVKYLHKECNKIFREKEIHDAFLDTMHKAGIKDVQLHPIPNEYCQCELCAPWFVVETPLTPMSVGLVLGWRKRVINIRLNHPAINFEKIFTGEDFK
jgi:hypothetical protein